MIRTEIKNSLVRTWSDAGMEIHGGMPEGDYDEAWDPADLGRTYTETTTPIEAEEPTEEDYAAAGRILLGEDGEEADA